MAFTTQTTQPSLPPSATGPALASGLPALRARRGLAAHRRGLTVTARRLRMRHRVLRARGRRFAVRSRLTVTTGVRRCLAAPGFRVYNRWILAVIALNAILLAVAFGNGWATSAALTDLTRLGLIAQLNFAIASLIRQQYLVNALTWLVTRVPTSAPLLLRRSLAQIHHLGGIHVGGAASGTLWHLIFVANLIVGVTRGTVEDVTLNLVLSATIGALLTLMVILALPPLRHRWHDAFEATHRFGGWILLGLVWTNSVAFVISTRSGSSVPEALSSSPTVGVIVLTTISALLPWLRLRRIPVTVEHPSTHAAIVHLHHRASVQTGSTRAISRNPVYGWHSFANVPRPVGTTGTGYRMVVSNAGDWTGEFLRNPPTHVWVRGTATLGMANCRKLFTKVVFVATGSGIGPLLGHIVEDGGSGHLVWVTRNPRQTYGDGLVDEVLAAQPTATIWDSSEKGKPDLLELALAAQRRTGAEAVIIVANQPITWRVVEGLQRQGIPAFGAIWDS